MLHDKVTRKIFPWIPITTVHRVNKQIDHPGILSYGFHGLLGSGSNSSHDNTNSFFAHHEIDLMKMIFNLGNNSSEQFYQLF